MKLKDAAAVRSGLVLARKQAKDGGQYQYPLITLRALREDGTLITQSGDTYCTEEPLRPEYLSQPGDIVMRLTVPYTAVLIEEDTAGMVISSNFAVIRCREGTAVPAYLHWLLNTESMRRRFYKDSAGNMLSAVSPRVLAGINPTDFRWHLEPGESFQTPEAVLVYSNSGRPPDCMSWPGGKRRFSARWLKKK